MPVGQRGGEPGRAAPSRSTSAPRRSRGRRRGTRPATRGRWTGPGRSAAWGGARSPRCRRRELDAAHGPLPHAGDVAVAGEADLAELGEAEPDPHRARPTGAPAWTGSSVHRHLAADGEVLAGALAAAGGRDGRGDDVLDAVAGAGAAVVAGRPAAVLEADLGQGVAPVLPEEVLVQAGREVVPRAAPRPRCGGGRRTSRPSRPWRLEGVEPEVEVEVLGPLLEGAAVAPHVLDDRPRRRSPRLTRPSAMVALGSCHLSLHARGRGGASSRSRLTLRCSSSRVFWPNHWNGVNGLGTKPPTRDGDRRALVVLACRSRRSCGPARRCRGCPRRSRWAGR